MWLIPFFFLYIYINECHESGSKLDFSEKFNFPRDQLDTIVFFCDKQGQAWTSRDKAGTSRDKAGQTGTNKDKQGQ